MTVNCWISSATVYLNYGEVKCYTGNYSDYMRQKDAERQRQELEYGLYISERRRLETALINLKGKARRVRKAPGRMGISEARLHRRRSAEAQEKLNKSVKAIRSRLDKLEVKEKPRVMDPIKMEFRLMNSPATRYDQGKHYLKIWKASVVYNLNLKLLKDQKLRWWAKNRTERQLCLNDNIGHPQIKVADGVRIGYFSQELDILDPGESILDNIMKSSYQPEWIVRTILARLLFKRDDVYKKVGLLSGGERVKASLAKLLVSEANLLILDEPTNYLDVFSMEALQTVLAEYEGTILLVTHDRWLIDNVAERIIVIENCKARTLQETYTQYLSRKDNSNNEQHPNDSDNLKERETILRMRMAEITGRLTIPGKNDNTAELEAELEQIVDQLKELQK